MQVPINDRSHALKWIIEDERYGNGEVFCSYSSLKMYRDCGSPFKFRPRFFVFGTELHAQFLENKSVEKLTIAEKRLLRDMLKALRSNKLVMRLMQDVLVEQEFKRVVYKMNCCGKIDILARQYVADLKSTSTTNLKQFIASMDFLQVAMYLMATGLKDFYYIGISKMYPHKVFVFNAADYPERIKAAQAELKKWLLKLKIDLKKHGIDNRYTRTKTVIHGKTRNPERRGLHNEKVKGKIPHRKKIIGRFIRNTNKRKQ